MMTNVQVANSLAKDLGPIGLVSLDQELPGESSIGTLRRRRKSRFEDDVGVITLLDIGGVLVWEDGAVSPATSRYRRRGAGTAADGEVVTQLKYKKPLGKSSIAEQLERLDRVLTEKGPAQLLQWDTATWQATPISRPEKDGRILLFVHGTFSNSGKLIEDLWDADAPGSGAGADFLRKAAKKYSQVLSFDHFTLSRTPLLNAIELTRLFDDSNPETLDVVCHSRGGLVTRWWCEVLDRRTRLERRVVFLGCPLQGTSLADPASLRQGLNLLANIGRALGAAANLIPFLTVAGGLMQIVSSITSVAAKTPLLDAGVAMVPGLASMSRITNNHELNCLNALAVPASAQYYAVTSDFEPEELSWKFWRVFTDKHPLNAAADRLVFQQANDLVVDTPSMTHHAWGANPVPANGPQFRCFEPRDRVHHTSYFREPRAIEFIENCLGLS